MSQKIEQIKHYKILETLGTGGMGVVYRGFDTILERDVAIKLMHSHLVSDEVHAQRLIREAQAVAKITHPNIVTIYEIGNDDAGQYIAMEYVNGKSISKLLESEEKIETERIIKIILQILNGLSCAHEKQIYHRDIKPENIFVTDNDLVKILDFGIAKMSSKQGLTTVGDILGTIEYMSPEQMLGEEFDHRCDIYATGILLYQLLTKKLPFNADTPVAILFKKLNEEPLPPSQFNSKIATELDEIVLKAIQRDKNERWKSAEAFYKALERYLQNLNATPTAVNPMPAEVQEEVELDSDDLKNDIFHPVFVGRETEYNHLKKLFGMALKGNGKTAIISGEAGVGKSTLAATIQKHALSNGAFVLYGACLYQDGMDAYMPYIEALRTFFTRDSHTLPAENRQHVKNLIREKIPVLLEFTERFATSFGDTNQDKAVDPSHKTLNMLEGIHLLISLISKMKPVVLVIDDLQWADDASLKLFHYLSRNIENHRVFQIGISRTDKYDLQQNGKPAPVVDLIARLRRENICEEIQLERFTRELCDKLIEKTLRKVNFSDEFYELLFTATKGNPFFVLETLKTLCDNNTIYLVEGTWYNKPNVRKLEIPDRVEDVFMRQFAELKEDEREILQVASVLGYKFDIAILARVLDIKKITLLRTLQRLQAELHVISSNNEGFQFEHPMLRETLYNEIPIALRREYHLLVAEELETMYGPDYGAMIGEVAFHYYHGGNTLKAIPLLYQGGKRAFKVSAYHQAIKYFEIIDELISKSQLDTSEIKLDDFYLFSGICYEEMGSWELALRFYHQLLEFSIQENLPKGQIDALRRIGRIYDHQGKWDLALEKYQKCLEILDSHPIPNTYSRIYNNIGLIYFQKGEYETARDYFEKTIAAVDDDHGEIDKGHALNNLGNINNMMGNHQKALETYYEAIEIYRSKDAIRNIPRVYHNIGMVYYDLGQWDKAIDAFDKCLSLIKDATITRQLQGLTYLNLGKVYVQSGNLAKAEKLLTKSIKLFQQLDDELSIAEANIAFGISAMKKGDFESAKQLLVKSLSINEQHDFKEGIADTYMAFGLLSKHLNEIDEALKYFQKSANMFKDLKLYGKTEKALQELEQIYMAIAK